MAMKLPRRQFLHLAAGVAALPAISRSAFAQTYPARPVRVIVATAAGATTDITAPVIGRWLSDRPGPQCVIENRPGGGNNIGTEAVVRAPADGYTLLLVNSVNAINATLFEKLSYNFINDIAPVAGFLRVPMVLQVNPAVPARTAPEFIAYAKANPGKINMASAGIGSTPHVAGELFKMMAGLNMLHVPYRGGAAAITDLIGGQVQVMIAPITGPLEHIRAGKLRGLAVTTTARSEALPDLPTLDTFVPGYEASPWYGLGAPKNTPTEIVDKLNREINAAFADPRMTRQIAELGGTPLVGSAADFGNLIVEETAKWGKVVKFSGTRPE